MKHAPRWRRFDESVLETLIRAIEDPRHRFCLLGGEYRGSCRLLVGGKSAELLLDQLPRLDPEIGFQVVRALSRIRTEEPRLYFNHQAVSTILGDELRRYYQELVLLEAVPRTSERPGVRFLRRAMKERLAHRLDWVFPSVGVDLSPERDLRRPLLDCEAAGPSYAPMPWNSSTAG